MAAKTTQAERAVRKRISARAVVKATSTVRRRASRLDPEVRKDLILDSAAKLMARSGISNCSLNAVAKTAHVSKALVYKYFPNRDALFEALLRREFEHIRGQDLSKTAERKATESGRDLDVNEVLELGVHGYLNYLVERGPLFRMLVNDAGVASQVQSALREGQDANMRFWTDQMLKAYGIPFDLARVGTIMTSYALEGVQGSVRSGKIDADRLADFWTTFVCAGWKAVGEAYGDAKPTA